MLKLDTIAELHALHLNQVQESATLEYKASPAIENTDKRKVGGLKRTRPTGYGL
jgi:hypothetical protein